MEKKGEAGLQGWIYELYFNSDYKMQWVINQVFVTTPPVAFDYEQCNILFCGYVSHLP